MGESVYEGTLTKWLKKVGDTVMKDEPLLEISTDKVDSEIPSPASGMLSEILVPEGATIQIDTTLAIIEESNGSRADAGSDAALHETPPSEKRASESAPDIIRNSAGASEARIQPVPETPETPPAGAHQVQQPSEGVQAQSIRTSPLVRKIARENNIDLTNVPGTGLGGRITHEDMLKYMDTRPPSKTEEQKVPADSKQEIPPPREKTIQEAPPTISETVHRVEDKETVPMSPMRKAIAEHMVYSKRTSAHVNTVFEVDLHSIVRLRERIKEDFKEREGIPLTFTPFFAKALVDTVREYPILNASISGEDIIYKKPVNLGIAVALENGLIVPVIKNAQLKSLTGIALKIADLAARARTKKLSPEDVQDGTISITNSGRLGALFATPIISQPQVAILGIGGIEKRPVVIDDAIAIRPMVCLSLTYDHRVIDGAVADQFMAALKERLQAWTQWPD